MTAYSSNINVTIWCTIPDYSFKLIWISSDSTERMFGSVVFGCLSALSWDESFQPKSSSPAEISLYLNASRREKKTHTFCKCFLSLLYIIPAPEEIILHSFCESHIRAADCSESSWALLTPDSDDDGWRRCRFVSPWLIKAPKEREEAEMTKESPELSGNLWSLLLCLEDSSRPSVGPIESREGRR